MADILQPGASLVFMKVGTHANEALSDILRRKRQEIEDAGFALWGYGGNTCHPLTMVQPFAHDVEQSGGVIHLVMQPMASRHFAVRERADDFSRDGINWDPIPREINVVGSRYALAINDLREEEFQLPLAHTRVAIGNSVGRRGDRYIVGHVDKACLEVVDEPVANEEERVIDIGLVAKLVDPYAVFVR
jgi:hypothetical protein